MKNLNNIKTFLKKYYDNELNYSIGCYKEESISIEFLEGKYLIYSGERGIKHNLIEYSNFNYAIRDFLERISYSDEEYKLLINAFNKEFNNNIILNFSNEDVFIDESRPSIFLAGPTRRNSNYMYSWRKEAIDILEKLNFKGIVYIPECFGDYQFDYNSQVLWERKGLENASKIIFWIPRKFPDMLGQTTNIEFGMYLARNPEKIIYGRPIDSEKNKYLDWLYNYELSKIPYETLEDVLKETLK